MDSKLKDIKTLFHQLKDGHSTDSFNQTANKIIQLSHKYIIEINTSDLIQNQLNTVNSKNKTKSKSKDKTDKSDKVNKKDEKKEKKEKEEKTKEIIKPSNNSLSSYSSCLNKDNDINSGNVYILSRVIGGLCSTGLEYRKGYTELLAQLIKKYDDIINYNNLIEVTNKESHFKKTENAGIKNALSTGKMAIFKCIISNSKAISHDLISKMMKETLNNADVSTNSEEYSIECFQAFFEDIQLEENKKFQALVEEVINSWLIKEKSFLFTASLILVINNIILRNKIENNSSKRPIINYFNNLLKSKPKYIIDNYLFGQEEKKEKNLKNFFIEIVTNNKTHIALQLLVDYIALICKESKLSTSKNSNNLDKLALVYNTITDNELANELISISNKNYQYLLTKVSLCFIDNIPIEEKIYNIFNINYFKIFFAFEGGKSKNSNVNQIIAALLNRLKTINNKDKLFENYCLSMLDLYRINILSPISYKALFLFLFGNLQGDQKEEYIDLVISENIGGEKNKKKAKTNNNGNMDIDDEVTEEEEEFDSENYKLQLYKKVNILKNLINVRIK